MSYEIQIQETKKTTIFVENENLPETLELISAIGPSHFKRTDAKAMLKQTGSYTFSHDNKMITIKYVSDHGKGLK